MYSFSKSSQEKLSTCHPDLIAVCNIAITVIDFTVIYGFRNNVIQDQLFREGKSQKRGGQSVHNVWPSEGVDVAPYPIDWEDIDRFIALGGVMMGIARCLNIPLRWGGDWDGDWNFKEERFRDFCHLERRKRI